MKRFLIILISLFITGCSIYKTNNEISYGSSNKTMSNSFKNYYNIEQFDSICKADTLNTNISNWEVIKLKDYDTNENIYQYFYIKSIDNYEIIYRVHIINDSIYKITKRIKK